MNDAMCVQFRHRLKHWHHQNLDVRLSHALRAAKSDITQRFAGVIRHRHVGGTVLLPGPMHSHQRRMRQLRQQVRLAQEALQPRGIGFGKFRRARRDAAVANTASNR